MNHHHDDENFIQTSQELGFAFCSREGLDQGIYILRGVQLS